MQTTDTLDRQRHIVLTDSHQSVLARSATVIFTFTVFTGAALLFLVQPMFARLVLPRLGGSPSVWNTCMLFFQGALLLGYAYAHLSTKWLGARRQARWHVLVLLIPLACLPIAPPSSEPTAEHPVRWLLGAMTLTVGLPFFAVSTTAPLLQRWFATLPVRSSHDPYFLYAASNVGSVLALLAYPFVLEPLVGVRQQTWLWAAGYLLLIALTVGCARMVRTRGDEGRRAGSESARTGPVVSTRQRLLWVAFSFLPSSLMLGVTSYITADLAAVPLLWVVPLAMYLLTFVLAFARRRLIPEGPLTAVTQVLIVVSLLTIFINSHRWVLAPFHLITFFGSALACHYRLAERRPDVSHLTEYYLWLSVGGVLGGVFNSLLAPQLFSTVLEYPMILGVIPAALWWTNDDGDRHLRAIGTQVAATAACLIAAAFWFKSWPGASVSAIVFALTVGFCARVVLGARSVGVPVSAVLLLGLIASGAFVTEGAVLFVDRSFFGVHRVVEARDHSHRMLFHGSTLHGRQELGAGRCPLSSYYFADGPVGQLMSATRGRRQSVAVVGLGMGTLACYADPGDRWTVYEIDPMVDYLARRSGLFTQVADSAGHVSVVLGDGRLKMQSASTASYAVIVLDAFTSDAVPMHLLTREAIQEYMSRLKPDGLLISNISNRYVELKPILARIAQLERLHARARFDGQISEADARRGRSASHWFVMARDASAFATIDRLDGWTIPTADERVRPWTDDYSNLFQALKFR